MKKLLAVSALALVLAACSESTAPSTSAVLDARYGKSTPVPPPPPAVCPSGSTCATFDNDAIGISALSDYGISSIVGVASPNGEYHSPRLANGSLTISPTGGPVNGQYDVHFNLYIIGAWYGEGSRKDVDQVIQMTWQCGASAPTQVMYASFANLLSGVTSYPLDVSDKGHFGGQYYNNGLDVLGYKGSGETEYYTNKGDVADSRYNVERIITTDCAAGQFHVTLTGIGLTSVNVASWAIDNLSVN